MKVVFIVTCLPVGGAEMALYRLLSQFDGSIKPHVISLQKVDEVGEMIRKLDIPVDALGMVPGRPNPLAVFDLARRLRRIKPDLVQTWMYHADLLGGIAAKLALPGCPVVWSVRHNSLSPKNTKRATIMVARACAWLSAWLPRNVVFNSESSCALHAEFGYSHKKCMVIPNGLDLQLFVPDLPQRASLRAELGLAADTPLVGMFARFDPIKNHEGFVQIARQLHSRMPGCHFVMSGLNVDSHNQHLAKWVADAGLGTAVHLLGPRRDMPKLMAAIDVLAMPSLAEAFPNVVAEAMACGVPCVVTTVGDGPRIAGEVGLSVPAGDIEAFVSALERILLLPESARKQQAMLARARIEQNYELSVMARRFESLYRNHVPGSALTRVSK